MENDNSYNCPLCGKPFESDLKLRNHFKKSVDKSHMLMSLVIAENKIRSKDVIDMFHKYVERYINDVNDKDLKELALIINKDIISDIVKAKKKKASDKRKKEATVFDELPAKDKPVALLNEFYDKLGIRCFNYAMEVRLIKNLYVQQKLSADDIRKILMYMIQIGHTSLRSINYVLNDAFSFYDNLQEVDKYGTVAYAVKTFYSLNKMKMNKKTFMKEINVIKSSMIANNLSFKEVINVIKGMNREKITVLLWFDSYVSRFRNNLSLNPCKEYSLERELKEIINEIMNGKMKYINVPKKLKKPCFKILKGKYLSGDFDKRYNYFEWAFKILLTITPEMYKLGIEKNCTRVSRFDEALKYYANNDEMTRKVLTAREKFYMWIETQTKKFQQEMM